MQAKERDILLIFFNIKTIIECECKDKKKSQRVNMTTRQQVIDVANLETGIYFINIKTDKGNIVRRFIKNEE